MRLGPWRFVQKASTSVDARRAHIAYVVHTLNPGGTERLVVDMSLAFSATFRVSVFCLDEPGIWADDLRDRGISVHCLWRQAGLDISVALRLAQYFRETKVNIVHAHQCTPWFYAALSRLRYSAPRLLLEEHGRFHPEEDNRLRRWMNRMLIRRLTHRFVAVSQDIRERLVRYEGLDHKQIEVVYNGVACVPKLSPSVRQNLRKELGFSEKCFVVGSVGRFDKIKNLPMLVEGVSRASSDVPQLQGLLVGDGPEFLSIQSLTEEFEVSERFRFTGFRSDARDLVQCMDLFVLSSFSEGTSMALLEAMSTEVPVAVTAVGGNPEIVEKDVSGWVVPSGAIDSLADVFREAARHLEKSAQFSIAARERFTKYFSFSNMIDSYGEIYDQLLAGTTRNDS